MAFGGETLIRAIQSGVRKESEGRLGYALVRGSQGRGTHDAPGRFRPGGFSREAGRQRRPSIDPPPVALPLAIAQQELLNLPGRRLGQLAELDRLGHLEPRELAATMLYDLVL